MLCSGLLRFRLAVMTWVTAAETVSHTSHTGTGFLIASKTVLVSEPVVSAETPEKTARYVTSVATILLNEKSDYFLVDLGVFLG